MPEVSGHLPSCRLCGSAAVEQWGRKRGQHFTDREFTFWRCRDCDLRFVDPVTGPEIYDEAYYTGRGVDPLVNYDAEYRNYQVTPRIEEFQGLAALADEHVGLEPARPDPVAWLDFGCGAGGLIRFLLDRRVLGAGTRRLRVDPAGVDVGSYADRLRRDGLNIYTPAGLNALPDGSFDIISLIEVVEHLEHPLEALALCSRLLKPGGLLLLTTGNLASPIASRQGINFAYCIPEIHIALWTPQALRLAYARVGLEPVQKRCTGAIRFKILKNLDRFALLKAGGSLWLLPPIVRMFDWLFGASAMPMAVKPVPGSATLPEDARA
jgi:SAM-dependent methyltransferase